MKDVYNVVYPHIKINNVEDRQIPKYNIYGDCYNSIEVSQVFETYEFAKQASVQENRKLRSYCSTVSAAKKFTEE